MYKIHLPKLKRSIETRGEITLLELLRAHDIPLANSCSGEAVCGWCKVRIVKGLSSLHAPTQDERELRQKQAFLPDERLACQIWVEQDMTIEVDYW